MVRDIYIKHKEIINYLIVGFLTTIVSLATYFLCVITVLDPANPIQLQIANIISWIAAVSFAYITNRRFVFYSHNPKLLREGAAFFCARLGTLFMDMGTMFTLVTLMSVNDKVAKLIVQVIVTIANYLISKAFVFKKP